MHSDTLKATDEYSAAKATAPRVSLADMEGKIVREFYVNGGEAAQIFDQHTARNGPLDAEIASLKGLTICVLVMQNGFTVIGKSAPASLDNFDEEKGRRFAYEDAIKQLWPLEGYALREKLAA
jgi:hypothetical protein